jgi:hypothetical protein
VYEDNLPWGSGGEGRDKGKQKGTRLKVAARVKVEVRKNEG